MPQRTEFTSVHGGDLRFINDLSLFKNFSGKQFSLYTMSKMGEFHPEDDFLEYYSSVVKSKLTKLKYKSVTADICMIESVPFSPKAVQIAVSFDNNPKYCSYLVSFAQNITENDTDYPLLLVFRSSSSVLNNVHKILEKMFLCYIKPLDLLKTEIYWITAIGINELIRRRINKGLRLSYSLPKSSNKSSFNMNAFSSGEIICYLFEKHLFNQENKLLLRNIEELFSELHTHFYNTYGFDFSFCNIDQVFLEGFTLKCNKKTYLNISSPDVLYLVLIYMHSLVYEKRGVLCRYE